MFKLVEKKAAKSFHIPNKFPGKEELLDLAIKKKEAVKYFNHINKSFQSLIIL